MFKTWSYSALDTYRQCPLRAKLRYIDKIPDPGNKYSARGNDIHNELETIVRERLPVPEKYAYFADGLTTLADQNPTVEKMFMFDSRWQPTDDRGQVWLYVKQDLMVVQPGEFLLTVDYKSGRKDGNEAKHVAQKILYSIAGWILHPDLPEYIAEMWYIDQKQITSRSFTPDLLEAARARLDAEVGRMFDDKLFRPRPSIPTCKWCPYGPRGTGHCPVGL
jgi:CRISPR/Cas system-associated exonuclease Cas4 (RecB family)